MSATTASNVLPCAAYTVMVSAGVVMKVVRLMVTYSFSTDARKYPYVGRIWKSPRVSIDAGRFFGKSSLARDQAAPSARRSKLTGIYRN